MMILTKIIAQKSPKKCLQDSEIKLPLLVMVKR